MAFKTAITIANAGWRQGRPAALALLASIAVLVPILLWRLLVLLS